MHRLAAFCTVLLVALAVVPAAAGDPSDRRGRGSEGRRPVLAPAGRDGLTRALGRGRLSGAEYALERAESLFRPARARARSEWVRGTDPHLATMYLRDLALRAGDLTGDDRRRARGLLARPTDGDADPQGTGFAVPPEEVRRDCTDDFCLHWVETTGDAPDTSADADVNTVPDWIDAMAAELTTISAHFGASGYRPPKSDLTSADNGGDGRLDVYVMNLFPKGMYGYCATDDPNILDPESGYEYFDASAYCVLDNDYAEYPMPGLPSLQVTAAHELFHAVQYAYDAFEDIWLLEGTAVWMEDEIYDDIDDNRQYLSASHLATPYIPLDNGDFATVPYPYGSFLFWRFLAEHPVGGGAEVIRHVWERADASPSGPHPKGFDDYSLLAVEKEVAERGATFAGVFRDFGVTNYVPEAFYEEGAGYLAARAGSRPPLTRDVVIKRWRPRKAGSVSLDHLTTSYLSFRPGGGVKWRRANLVVKVDGPPRSAGTEASLLVFRTDGTVTTRTVPLDAAGDGKLRPAFGRRNIARIVVVLTNASTRFDTRTQYRGATPFSWGGAVPLDDLETFSFVGRLRQ